MVKDPTERLSSHGHVAKPLAWDITIADMYANSHICDVATSATAAAVRACFKSDCFGHGALQVPTNSIQLQLMGGSWNDLAFEFTTELWMITV